eukprot:856-Heterococcus_DN1.PRE.1
MKNIMNGHGPNALTKRAGSSKSDIVSILHSAHVDDLYQRNRDERSAAIQLQAWWRHYSIRTKFELMARQGRLIVRIQALVRGVIYRKRIAEWYTQRLRMVTGWQRLIRRGLSNRRIARSRAAETVLIIRIQALYRGRRDRSIVMTLRHAQAATTIQRVWRGAVGRVLADRLWLDINITPMQKVARGMLARKAVAVYRSSRHSAAVTLQRCFRGYTARYQRAQAAVQRETDRRQDWLRVLASEEDWLRSYNDIHTRRTQKLHLDTVLAAAVVKEAQERTDIHKLQQPARWGARLYLSEYKLVAVLKHKSAVYNTATSARYSKNSDIAFFTLAYPQASQGLNLQRSLLSPRALQQGWREELDNNITHYRKEITKVGIITQLLHAIHSSTSYLLENVTYADSRAQTCYNTFVYPVPTYDCMVTVMITYGAFNASCVYLYSQNKLELLFGTCVEVRSIEADISKRYEQEHELRQFDTYMLMNTFLLWYIPHDTATSRVLKGYQGGVKRMKGEGMIHTAVTMICYSCLETRRINMQHSDLV